MRIKNLFITFCFIITLLLSGCAKDEMEITASGDINDEIIKTINSYIKENNIKESAIVVGTIANNKEGFYFYGRELSKSDKSPDKETLFDIGSITKTFTASMLQIYINNGSLKIDDPVNKYISNYRLPDFNGAEISLKDLLTHSSGLPLFHIDLSKAPNYDYLNPLAGFSIDDIYRSIQDFQIYKKPGAIYDYSNTGYVIIADILTHISGKNYNELLNEFILDELDMHDTVLELDNKRAIKLAQGHSNTGSDVRVWDISAYLGAGGIFSNISDMMKWLNANIEPQKTKISASLDSAHILLNDFSNKYDFKMGSAWFIEKVDGKNVYCHGGRSGGFRTMLSFSKDEKSGVVILTAIDSDSYDAIEKLSFDILRILGI